MFRVCTKLFKLHLLLRSVNSPLTTLHVDYLEPVDESRAVAVSSSS